MNRCFSHVGRTGGAQPVSLGRGCVHVGIAIHELMHAAGFWHEQSRADRDEHIMIMYDNIADGMSHNFLKYNLDRIQHLGMPYDTGKADIILRWNQTKKEVELNSNSNSIARNWKKCP